MIVAGVDLVTKHVLQRHREHCNVYTRVARKARYNMIVSTIGQQTNAELKYPSFSIMHLSGWLLNAYHIMMRNNMI